MNIAEDEFEMVPIDTSMEEESPSNTEDDDVSEFVREIYRRESRGSSMVAVAKLFGSGRQVLVKKSFIFTRCEHVHLSTICGLYNPHRPTYKFLLLLVSIIGYFHSYYTLFDVSFHTGRESLWLFVVDQLVNVMFIVEMYIQSRTAL